MRKIITLFLALSFVSTINAQRKIELPKAETSKIEYVDIQQIIDRKAELELTDIQSKSFIIKNEYIKRDMYDLNNKKNLERINKKMYLKELNNSYQLFIERQLTAGQLEKWTQIKSQLATENDEHSTLKEDIAILHEQYKIELKELEVKFSADPKMFKRQKQSLSKYYNIKASKLDAYYKSKNTTGEETEPVMTLEEIANLLKDFEDSTSSSSPLEYINIQETQEEVVPE